MSDVNEKDAGLPRRTFLSRLSEILMASGLVASGGTIAAFVGRYLYPREGLKRKRSLFLTTLAEVPPGTAKTVELQGGGSAVVTNTGDAIVALSDVCPHLGCRVRWEEADRVFFCPCHGGVFSKEGKALKGPPADEGKDLKTYEVEQVGESVFITVEEHLS